MSRRGSRRQIYQQLLDRSHQLIKRTGPRASSTPKTAQFSLAETYNRSTTQRFISFVFVNLSSYYKDRLEFGRVDKLPAALIDPDRGELVHKLEIAPHTGKILLKDRCELADL